MPLKPFRAYSERERRARAHLCRLRRDDVARGAERLRCGRGRLGLCRVRGESRAGQDADDRAEGLGDRGSGLAHRQRAPAPHARGRRCRSAPAPRRPRRRVAATPARPPPDPRCTRGPRRAGRRPPSRQPFGEALEERLRRLRRGCGPRGRVEVRHENVVRQQRLPAAGDEPPTVAGPDPLGTDEGLTCTDTC